MKAWSVLFFATLLVSSAAFAQTVCGHLTREWTVIPGMNDPGSYVYSIGKWEIDPVSGAMGDEVQNSLPELYEKDQKVCAQGQVDGFSNPNNGYSLETESIAAE